MRGAFPTTPADKHCSGLRGDAIVHRAATEAVHARVVVV
jgi:hypothetical protein